MRVVSRTMFAGVMIACAASIAGCGMTRSASIAEVRIVRPVITDPLARLSAEQIATKVQTDMMAAPTERMAGTVADSGKTVSMDLTILPKSGDCEGSLGVAGDGSFQLVVIGTVLWIRPDSVFWERVGASPTVAAVKGKFLETTGKDAVFGSLATLCNFKDNPGTPSSEMRRDGTAMVGGQRTVVLLDPTDRSLTYVTDTATPVAIRSTGGKSSAGYVNITVARTPAKITPPPSGEVVFASNYGL